MIREVIRKFAKLLNKKQKKKLGLLFVLMLIGTILEVMSVSVMVPILMVIMDESIIENNHLVASVCSFFNITSYKSFVFLCIGALIVVYVLKDSFIIFQNYVQAKFICDSRVATQKKLLEAIMMRPYEYFLNARTGEITQMIIRDPANSYSLLATMLVVVTDTIVSVALGITVFVLEPQMTFIVVSVLLICMLIITLVARPHIQKAGLTFRRSNSSANNWVIQIVSGIKEIKVTRREKFFTDEYVNLAKTGADAEKTFKTISGIPRSMIEMVSICAALSSIMIMITGGRTLTELLPSLSAFAVAAMKLLPSANKIANGINEISYQEPFLNKLIENIEYFENVGDDVQKFIEEETASDGMQINKGIFVKNLSFMYPGTEKLILDGADMEIPLGTSVGIVGPSGAGKTTTVDILLGLLKKTDGEIFADEESIFSDYTGWLSNIGYIPQSIFLLDGSIRDNVAFGISKDQIDDSRVWNALREAQLEEFVKGLPDGLDSKVGERGIRISGGQKQRLGIARALYYDPPILVLDEATSSLDNATESAIMDSVNSLHGRKTMIIIAHRLQTIEGCDMVYRVADGKITRER